MSSYPWDYQEGESRYSPRATVVQVESLGKGAWAILTAAMVLASLALAVAWAASVRATLAEREARIAQDKYFYVAAELAKAGIEVSTDGH